ncbi:P-loop containing nucleoside triphosphate hydrolase protein [Mycena latifolia]|nr:P-loop containing nucleoside triphosphate hydrolase protein [Mycena latifolia]
MEDVEDTTPIIIDEVQRAQYEEVLKRVFRIPAFRNNQLETIATSVAGRDTFVLMPTGAGKSLCYQLPAVFQNEQTNGAAVTVVVSPLVALINNQVKALNTKGVDAIGLTTGTYSNVVESRLRHASKSNPALLYVTPEKLQKCSSLHATLRVLHNAGHLARFAIDEAHCVSTWGPDFREAYLELYALRDDFPGVPIMALTATAGPKTIADIIGRLMLTTPAVFRQSLNRPNLEYIVKQKQGNTATTNEIVAFVKNGRMDQSGIIYRTRRAKCEELAKALKSQGISAMAYHAGLGDKEKESAENEWNREKCRIIVATVAFGMGIDKPNVRFIIHYESPKSMESYYQETGRAGRDGLPAVCICYYSYSDSKAVLNLIPSHSETSSEPATDHQKNVLAVIAYCEEQSICRRVLLLKYFEESFDKNDCSGCSNCSNAVSLVSKDYSKDAHLAVSLVQSLDHESDKITVLQCVAVFRGANTEDTRKNGRNRNSLYGAGKAMSRDLANLLFTKLLYLDVLSEYRVHRGQGHYHDYLKVETSLFHGAVVDQMAARTARENIPR